jgi:hypothetical protein
MIKDNTYFYTIEEILINRKSDPIGKEPHQYLRLVIKHRLKKSTQVIFTKSIRADAANAFEDLLEVARKMRETY